MGSNLIGRAFESFKRIREGLGTVLMHSFRDPTTMEYPDVVPQVPPHFRGRLGLTVNPDTGEHLCISCRQCERVCPDKCIEIVAHKSPETNKLELIDFKIDHGLCMFCGLCTEVCPTNCIINTNDFEMSDYTRESLVYDLRRLTLTQEESAFYFDKKEIPKPKPKPAKPAPGEAKGAAAGALKAAPAAEAKGTATTKGEAASAVTKGEAAPADASKGKPADQAKAEVPDKSAPSPAGSSADTKKETTEKEEGAEATKGGSQPSEDKKAAGEKKSEDKKEESKEG